MKYSKFNNCKLIMFLIFSVLLNFSLAKSKSKPYLNMNSYVAASILKTLGAKDDFQSLVKKFQNSCPHLRVVNEIKTSLKKINTLTSNKSIKLGYKFAKKALKREFNQKHRKYNNKKRYNSNNNKKYSNNRKSFPKKYDSKPRYERYPMGPPYEKGPYGGDRPYRDDGPYRGGRPNGGPNNFLERKLKNIKKNKKNKKNKSPTKGLKTNLILNKLCKGNYKNAKINLTSFKNLMKAKRKLELILVIKKILRRVLARILGCKNMKKGPMSKTIRRAMNIIRKKTQFNENVFKIANVLKKMTNSRRKPKLIRKTNRLIKQVLAKLLNRKKVNKSTLGIIENLKKQNCSKGKGCYRKNTYSKKCYSYAKACLKLKTLVNQTKDRRFGNVVSNLIKKFISN